MSSPVRPTLAVSRPSCRHSKGQCGISEEGRLGVHWGRMKRCTSKSTAVVLDLSDLPGGAILSAELLLLPSCVKSGNCYVSGRQGSIPSD